MLTQGMLCNFIKLNIIKKIIGIYIAQHTWLSFTMMFKVAHRPLYNDVAHIYGRGMIEFQLFFYFFSLNLEIHANPFKN